MKRLLFYSGIFFTTFLLSPFVSAQQISLAGFINNALTGDKIGSVNIFDKVSGIGTISNENGYFKLLLKQGEIKLTISEDGYKTFVKDFELKNDTVINVRLIFKKNSISDVLHANRDNETKDRSTSTGFLRLRRR